MHHKVNILILVYSIELKTINFSYLLSSEIYFILKNLIRSFYSIIDQHKNYDGIIKNI